MLETELPIQLAQQSMENSFCLLEFTCYEKIIRKRPCLVQAFYACNVQQLTLLMVFLSVMVSSLQVLVILLWLHCTSVLLI
jgi:hypothetical protein